jgi:hypothetical protein
MKLVIQNGCRHTLARKEFEPMLALFPPKWSTGVNAITFYSGDSEGMETRYFKKERILGVFWPHESQDLNEKEKAIEQILISLACISENSALCLDKSNSDYFSEITASIRKECFRMLEST